MFLFKVYILLLKKMWKDFRGSKDMFFVIFCFFWIFGFLMLDFFFVFYSIENLIIIIDLLIVEIVIIIVYRVVWILYKYIKKIILVLKVSENMVLLLKL